MRPGIVAAWINQLVFFGLILLILISPLPLGSYREWAWSLGAAFLAILGILWALANGLAGGTIKRVPPPVVVFLFLMVVCWVCAQLSSWVPESWKHPLWLMAGDTLGSDLPGRVSLASEDGRIALLRLLSYALLFFLAFQLGSDRNRARLGFLVITIAGLAYALFGLYVYWNDSTPEWLFGNRQLAHDLRSTFVNRNHFATWEGLALLCGIAWFYEHMFKPEVMPYFIPKNRDDQVEAFILKAWKPLLAILLMVTALVLTHSRGGFLSSLAGTVVLLWLLDRKGARRKSVSRMSIIAALLVSSGSFYLTSEMVLDRLENTNISTEERVEIFADVNRGIAANPVLGFGYGTFADSFRLYDRIESPYHYDHAHNTWLENAFELGIPAALMLYCSLAGLVIVCFRGTHKRHRDWVYPATGVAASVLVGLHATVDFSLQLPAVAYLYAVIMGIGCAQAYSSVDATS